MIIPGPPHISKICGKTFFVLFNNTHLIGIITTQKFQVAHWWVLTPLGYSSDTPPLSLNPLIVVSTMITTEENDSKLLTSSVVYSFWSDGMYWENPRALFVRGTMDICNQQINIGEFLEWDKSIKFCTKSNNHLVYVILDSTQFRCCIVLWVTIMYNPPHRINDRTMRTSHFTVFLPFYSYYEPPYQAYLLKSFQPKDESCLKKKNTYLV